VADSDWLPRQYRLNLQAKLSLIVFSLWGWMRGEIYTTKVDVPEELLARILNDAACIKKRAGRLRRTTRDLHTAVAKCTEFDGGIFKLIL
jgi:hypothetical protein